MIGNIIEDFCKRVNVMIDSQIKEMLSIYKGFDKSFTINDIDKFLKDNNLELRMDSERSYPVETVRYYIYDNNLQTDTNCFYYEIDKEKMLVDISKTYVWSGWDNR